MVEFIENMLDSDATLNNPISRKKSNKWDNPIGKNMSPLQQAKNVAMLIKKRLEDSSKNDQSKEVSNKMEGVESEEIDLSGESDACRRLLTLNITLNDIMKRSGAKIEVKRTQKDENDVENNEKLEDVRLLITATEKSAVQGAVTMVNKAISSLSSSSSSTIPTNTTTTIITSNLQEKVFVGLDQAPPSFNVPLRIQGDNRCFLEHIETTTGARVMLRGKGSGHIEPTSGREAFEPLFVFLQHQNVDSLRQALLLTHSLIQKVQQDYNKFKLNPIIPACPIPPIEAAPRLINYPLINNNTYQPPAPSYFGFGPVPPPKRPPLLPTPPAIHQTPKTAQNYYQNFLHSKYGESPDECEDANRKRKLSPEPSDRYSPTAMLEEEDVDQIEEKKEEKKKEETFKVPTLFIKKKAPVVKKAKVQKKSQALKIVADLYGSDDEDDDND